MMDFIKIYKAANLSEAHILEGLLEAESVKVQFLGEGLSVAAGELPLEVLQIDMYVKQKDKEKAQELISKYESNVKIENSKSWLCSKCEKLNPGTFEICWKCNS